MQHYSLIWACLVWVFYGCWAYRDGVLTISLKAVIVTVWYVYRWAVFFCFLFSNKAVEDGKALEYPGIYIIKHSVKKLCEGQFNATRVMHVQNWNWKQYNWSCSKTAFVSICVCTVHRETWSGGLSNPLDFDAFTSGLVSLMKFVLDMCNSVYVLTYQVNQCKEQVSPLLKECKVINARFVLLNVEISKDENYSCLVWNAECLYLLCLQYYHLRCAENRDLLVSSWIWFCCWLQAWRVNQEWCGWNPIAYKQERNDAFCIYSMNLLGSLQMLRRKGQEVSKYITCRSYKNLITCRNASMLISMCSTNMISGWSKTPPYYTQPRVDITLRSFHIKCL